MTTELTASPWPDPDHLGSLTDLYQLTMAAGWGASGMADGHATFEAFVRKLPPHRSYLVVAGIEPAVEAIRTLRFSGDQIEAIRRLPVFAEIAPEWWGWLERFRFRGSLWAVPEGTFVFAGEPIVRVEASLPEAQVIETLLLSMLSYPTSVATKASRIVTAAQGRPLIEMGARRGAGPRPL